MVAHKYGLENNRLQYKRIINKKEVWLNIPLWKWSRTIIELYSS